MSAELAAMQAIEDAFSSLSRAQIYRILEWAKSKYLSDDRDALILSLGEFMGSLMDASRQAGVEPRELLAAWREKHPDGDDAQDSEGTGVAA